MNPKPMLRHMRARNPMPDYVKKALLRSGVMAAYRGRPPYQQNDYLGWIGRAKQKETRDNRLAQMIRELISGDKYMKMDYHPAKRRMHRKK